MNYYIAAALLLSVMVNIGAIIVFVKMNKRESADPILTNDEIYIVMEEFVRVIEKENENLFQNMTDYIKVKEQELDEKIRSIEGQKEVSPIVEAEPELAPVIPQINDLEETGQVSVETLFKQGFSPAQIAKVLKTELSHVELIINMLKKKKSYQQ